MPKGHFIHKRVPLAIRLARHCLPPNEKGCIIWVGHLIGKGYGAIESGKRPCGARQQSMLAHHAAWEIANGREVPKGMQVMHACDTPACVNPAHLSLGTNADNIRDMIAKGRMSRGEKRAFAKLTENDVREIRRLSATGMSSAKISKQFPVSQGTVWKIVRRLKWAHVT